jgi:autotransporter translocation and assembly factor TamB
VEVVRSVNEARTRREAPIGFAFDLGIDLGPAFYIRGMGLDTRIDGAVRLRSDGRSIRATGVVEARDGVFEGFGQKLAIERGRVNFQGPVENPGLDVLALRRGLPVEVGVTITRTAQNPLIRLHSDEGLPDFQILSWLVLGRAADENGADRSAKACRRSWPSGWASTSSACAPARCPAPRPCCRAPPWRAISAAATPPLPPASSSPLASG